jgi:TP901 family phage tail tape measure protein
VAEVAKGIIDIEINTGSAASALQALQAQINAFNLALNKGNKSQAQFSAEYSKKLQEAINKTGLFTAETIRLETAAATLDKTLSKGKTSLGQYFSARFNKDGAIAAETMALASERARRLQTQFIATSGAAGGFQNALAVRPLAAFSTEMAVAGQRAEVMSAMFKQGTTQLINFGKNVQWAGRQLMVGFTVPLTIFGAVAGKTFMELEKQVVGFKKVYGDLFTTPAELNQNLEAVKGLASEYTKYGIAVKDTIGLAAQAAAAGRKNADLTDAVSQATRLATLGQMDQNAALETTISLQSAFRLSGQDLADTINFLNMVENQTVVSLQDIAAAIPRVAPVISGLGGDVKDLTVFLAAMQEGGVDAAEGANALKSGLASLINPTRQATDMLSGMGINLQSIIDINKGDLMGTVQSFAQALGSLDQFSRQQALEQVFGKFQYAKLGALFDNISRKGSQAQQVIATMGYTTEQLGSTADKELKTIEESFGVQLTGAVERFKLAIAPIGEIFVKLSIPLVNLATKIAEAFNGLSDGQKKFAAIGAVVIGVVVPAVTMLTGLFLNLVGTLAKMTQGVTLFTKGFLTGGPIGAMKALSQSSKYLSLAEMDAAMAAQQLAGASQALNATLVNQVGTSNAAAAAIGNLTRAYAAMIATQAGAASAFPEVFGVAGAAGAAAKGGGRARAAEVFIRGVQKRNSGGPIFMSNGTTVPGTGNTDTVPAMLTPGEFVVNKEATKNNLGLLHSINDTKKPQGLNAGGKAKGMQYFAKENNERVVQDLTPEQIRSVDAFDNDPSPQPRVGQVAQRVQPADIKYASEIPQSLLRRFPGSGPIKPIDFGATTFLHMQRNVLNAKGSAKLSGTQYLDAALTDVDLTETQKAYAFVDRLTGYKGARVVGNIGFTASSYLNAGIHPIQDLIDDLNYRILYGINPYEGTMKAAGLSGAELEVAKNKVHSQVIGKLRAMQHSGQVRFDAGDSGQMSGVYKVMEKAVEKSLRVSGVGPQGIQDLYFGGRNNVADFKFRPGINKDAIKKLPPSPDYSFILPDSQEGIRLGLGTREVILKRPGFEDVKMRTGGSNQHNKINSQLLKTMAAIATRGRSLRMNSGGQVPGMQYFAANNRQRVVQEAYKAASGIRRRVRPGKEERLAQQSALHNFAFDSRNVRETPAMDTILGMMKPLTQKTRATRGTVLGSTRNKELPYAQQKRIVAAIKEGRYEDLFGMKLNFKGGAGSYTTKRDLDFAPFIGDLSNPTLKDFSYGFMGLDTQKKDIDKLRKIMKTPKIKKLTPGTAEYARELAMAGWSPARSWRPGPNPTIGSDWTFEQVLANKLREYSNRKKQLNTAFPDKKIQQLFIDEMVGSGVLALDMQKASYKHPVMSDRNNRVKKLRAKEHELLVGDRTSQITGVASDLRTRLPSLITQSGARGYNNGGMIPKFNQGNVVPGIGNTDTVPAMLTPGEFVVNKESTKNNYDLLTAINDGNVSGFNKGGKIPGMQYFSLGGIAEFTKRVSKSLSTNISPSNLPKDAYNKLVKSVYQRKDAVLSGGDKVPTYKIQGNSYAFQGKGDDFSELAPKGVTPVNTTPQSLIEEAIKLNPKDKSLQKMLENVKNKEFGKREIRLLDEISAATSVNRRGRASNAENVDGYAMVLSSLSGNKNAKRLVDERTKSYYKIMADLRRKEQARTKEDLKEGLRRNPNRLLDEKTNMPIDVDPAGVTVFHRTPHPVTRDADGSVNILSAGTHNLGVHSSVPRPSVHTTLEAPVAPHLDMTATGNENWVISRLSTMIKDNDVPTYINPTDTWWLKNPGQALKFSDSSVVRPFTSKKQYDAELIKRGLGPVGTSSSPVIAIDSKTKDVLFLRKDSYSDADRVLLAKLSDELEDVIPGAIVHKKDPNSFIGFEDKILDDLSKQAAKKQIGISSRLQELSGPTLANNQEAMRIGTLNYKYQRPDGLHSNSYAIRLENMANDGTRGIPNYVKHTATGGDLEPMRMAVASGSTASTRRLAPPTHGMRANKGTIVPGVGNTDTVPAMLTPGEFVVNKEATSQNRQLLEEINNSKKPQKLNMGGMAYSGSREAPPTLALNSGGIARGVQYLNDGKVVKYFSPKDSKGADGSPEQQKRNSKVASRAVGAGMAGSVIAGTAGFMLAEKAGIDSMAGQFGASIVAGMVAQKALAAATIKMSKNTMTAAEKTKALAPWLSKVAPSLARFAVPLMGATVGFALLGFGVYKLNKSLVKTQKAGAELSEAMYGSAKTTKAIGDAFGRETYASAARRKQAEKAGGTEISQEAVASSGQFMQSDAGKGIVEDIRLVQKSGGDAVLALRNQLASSIIAGVISPEEARAIALEVGEAVGSATLGIQVSGELTSLIGPNGERILDNIIQITADISPKIDSTKITKDAQDAFDSLNVGEQFVQFFKGGKDSFIEDYAIDEISTRNSSALAKEAEARALLNLAYQEGTITLQEYLDAEGKITSGSNERSKFVDDANAQALGFSSTEDMNAELDKFMDATRKSSDFSSEISRKIREEGYSPTPEDKERMQSSGMLHITDSPGKTAYDTVVKKSRDSLKQTFIDEGMDAGMAQTKIDDMYEVSQIDPRIFEKLSSGQMPLQGMDVLVNLESTGNLEPEDVERIGKELTVLTTIPKIDKVINFETADDLMITELYDDYMALEKEPDIFKGISIKDNLANNAIEQFGINYQWIMSLPNQEKFIVLTTIERHIDLRKAAIAGDRDDRLALGQSNADMAKLKEETVLPPTGPTGPTGPKGGKGSQAEDKLKRLKDMLMQRFKLQEMLIDKEAEGYNKTIKGISREIQLQQRQIALEEKQVELRQKALEELSKKEDEVNTVYDNRISALDRVSASNSRLASQEQSRITLASALASGDIAGAATAMSEITKQSAESQIDDTKTALETQRETALKNLTVDVNGTLMTRKDIEASIETIQANIALIQTSIYDKNILIQGLEDSLYETEKKRLKVAEDREKIETRIYLLEQKKAIDDLNKKGTKKKLSAAEKAALAEYKTSYNNMATLYNQQNPGTPVQLLNRGGMVSGMGMRDTVPAMLTPGEFVIRKNATKTFLPLLESINSGVFPSIGGMNMSSPKYDVPASNVTNVPVSQSVTNSSNASTMYNNSYSINVNVSGSNSSADEIANVVMGKIARSNSGSIRGSRY